MFNIQHLPVYAVSLPPSNLRPTEALRTMPSATDRSAAFEQLALPLFPSLYNHAHWLTRNPSEAEDLVQETFTKALRAFDSFQHDTNFKAWIFRILRNTFLTTPDLRIIAVSDVNPSDLDNLMAALLQVQASL
jgi:hypothetical protein